MDPRLPYAEFERHLLHLAYTTDVPLTAPAIAYTLSIPVAEAQRHMDHMVAQGILELESDERGSLYYVLPGRREVAESEHLRQLNAGASPSLPSSVGTSTALALSRPAPELERAQQQARDGRSALALAMNLALPGVGSVVAGRGKTGWCQLSLFTAGLLFAPSGLLPLALAAWVWALATSVDVLTGPRSR